MSWADQYAAAVGREFRDTWLNGVMVGLEAYDVSPIEFALLAGLAFEDAGTNDSRGWKLAEWVEFIGAWIAAREPLVKAVYKAGGESRGATASKAYPNWLKPHEIEAWIYVRDKAGLRIDGIEDSVRAKLRSILADTITLGGSREKIAATAKERLAKVFESTGHDVNRIVMTELAAAFNDGVLVATQAANRTTRAAVVPQKDACPKCLELYLGPDGRPKIVEISALIAGKPQRPPLHPHCRCVVVPVPPGYGVDSSWNVVPGGKG